MEEVIKETKKTEEEVKQESTAADVKTNEELLKANVEISALQEQLQQAKNQLQEKEKAAKEEAFNKLLTKYKVKPEFQKFVKLQLQWENLTDLNTAIAEFIKENPALIETLTTGGAETTINTNDVKTSENPLLKYKEENYL